MSTAELYNRFATKEALPASPLYGELAAGVAADPVVLELLDSLPPGKRQPNLLFATVRYLDGTPDTYATMRDFVRNNWSIISDTMLHRRTQTNEPARCGALLPVLADLPGPLALIEVGASAGLCLYPDRYRYDYEGSLIGPADSPLLVECRVAGDAPVPSTVPDVRWRGGIDLNPLDVTDPDDLRWLECLVWPEEEQARLPRLHAAAEVARRDPPRLTTGDLFEQLPHVVSALPDDVTPVVFHTAVAVYLSTSDRERLSALVAELPVRWIAQEAVGVFPAIASKLAHRPARDVFVLSLDGEPVAVTAPHGGWLRWL